MGFFSRKRKKQKSGSFVESARADSAPVDPKVEEGRRRRILADEKLAQEEGGSSILSPVDVDPGDGEPVGGVEIDSGIGEQGAAEVRRASTLRFRTMASDRPNRGGDGIRGNERIQTLIRDVFAPTTPVIAKDFLASRVDELERIISSIEDERAHVIVYGHRGWGKTSLVNTVAQIAEEAGYLVVRSSCGAHANYSDMFRAFLADVPLLYDRDIVTRHSASEHNKGFDTLLPEGTFTAKELTDVMTRVSTTRVIMLLDEYDRIKSEDFKLAITETIKNFSDRAVRTQLLLVGVADTMEELIGLNPSIRRNVSGLQLRLLSDDDVDAMIRIGEEKTGLRFHSLARDLILNLSRNTPYNVRMLCLYASQNAVSLDSGFVTRQDVMSAAKRVIRECEPLVNQSDLYMVDDAGEGLLTDLLTAMVAAPANHLDEVALGSILAAMEELTGKPVDAESVAAELAQLASEEVGMIIRRDVRGTDLFSFTDPMMAFYLRLRYELAAPTSKGEGDGEAPAATAT